MAKQRVQQFLQKSEEKAFSDAHRQRIAFNMGKYHSKVAIGKQQFLNLKEARALAQQKKQAVLSKLPDLLEQFEAKFTQQGGTVIWASTIAEAQASVTQLMQKYAVESVVKSKSMITEEIRLNSLLEQQGIEVVETDLGEFIVQLKGEAPYHIVTPAMHLSKEDIAELFHEHFGTSKTATPEAMTNFANQQLRPKFLNAKMGITGGNFLIAETGSLVLVENEGNARLCTSVPDVHVAIVGIEKVLEKLEDLHLFLPLLSTYGTGQEMTVYNNIISGPRQTNEVDGPKHMYIILLDNGRSEMLADPKIKDALRCIRCGSCLNVCPVYQTIGGHSYESPYSGPIGAVISPHLHLSEENDFKHLSHASSLCGSCTDNCPVNIDLHGLLLYNRFLEQKEQTKGLTERITWKTWKKVMLNRTFCNTPSLTKKIFGSLVLKKQWGARRALPSFSTKTFNQLWQEGKV
jgi:L-lactate dehydrogenase complex protein LldF